jgi:uncharacterized membrane protein HdeD (DUF308 family)
VGTTLRTPDPVEPSRPRGAAILLGLVAVVLGVVLVTRPFASLTVLVWLAAAAALTVGALRWWSSRSPSSGIDRVVAMVWVLVAVAVVAWPNISLRALAWLVGGGMVVAGVGDVVGGLRGSTDERIASVLRGVASAILGVVAVAWPDVTVLVVAIVLGARTVLFGLSELIDAVRPRRAGDVTTGEANTQRRRPLRRFGRVATTAVALAAALGLGAVSAQLRQGEPVVDDFYTAPGQLPE